MSILHYFPTLNPSAQDIKQLARNLLLISNWFQQSPIAQQLKLSHAQEWIAKAYGFNSYAAYKAGTSSLTNPPPIKVKLKDVIKCDHPADTLFLGTVDSYLSAPKESLSKFPIYIEPTPLLLAVIEKLRLEPNSHTFINLAAINAIGIKVYRHKHHLSKTEVAMLLLHPELGLANRLIQYLDFTINKGEIDYAWGFESEHGQTSLSLKSIDRPIHIDPPSINLKKLAEILDVPEILSLSYQSRLMNEITTLTSDEDPVIEDDWLEDEVQDFDEDLDALHESYHQRDFDIDWMIQLERKGLKIEYANLKDEYLQKDDLGKGSLAIKDFISFELVYIDAQGMKQHCTANEVEQYLDLYQAKNSFRFIPPLCMDDEGVTRTGMAYEAVNFIASEITKTLEKHQYVLASVWINSDADFEHEMYQANDLKNSVIDIEVEIENQRDAIYEDIMANLKVNFDKSILDEMGACVGRFDKIKHPSQYQQALREAFENKRFQQRIEELMNEKIDVLRASLYVKKKLLVTPDKVNINFIRENYIHDRKTPY